MAEEEIVFQLLEEEGEAGTDSRRAENNDLLGILRLHGEIGGEEVGGLRERIDDTNERIDDANKMIQIRG